MSQVVELRSTGVVQGTASGLGMLGVLTLLFIPVWGFQLSMHLLLSFFLSLLPGLTLPSAVSGSKLRLQLAQCCSQRGEEVVPMHFSQRSRKNIRRHLFGSVGTDSQASCVPASLHSLARDE